MKNREIYFRGLTVDIKEWVYGSLIRIENVDLIGYYVITPPTNSDPGGDTIWHEELVIRNSVSQFTGLKDKNGVEIYEGDVIRLPMLPENLGFKNYEVYFDNGGFRSKSAYRLNIGEVIGNIFTSPELLTKNEK